MDSIHWGDTLVTLLPSQAVFIIGSLDEAIKVLNLSVEHVAEDYERHNLTEYFIDC